MSNLQKKTLKECLSLIIDNRGKTPPKIDFGAGYKIISANHVKFDGLVRLDSIDLGSEDTYSKWMVEELKKGDILLTSEAPAGQAMLWDSDEKVIVAQRLFALRVAPLVANNKFIKYYLQSYLGQKEISRNTSGSTVFGISARMFDQINVHLPECILKQSCIGNLLYLLDKKIELNNRINAELEAMAKTLYDYWFVQFDFPDANGKPYKTAGGKMVYNETLKREIPEGWSDGALDDLGQIVGGSTPSTQNPENFTSTGTPWITPYDLSSNRGNKFISRGAQDVSVKGIKLASLKKYPAGTVLLSSRAPIGYMAIARNEVTTNQGFKSFIVNKGYSTEFVYYTVNGSLKTITQYASGSTFKEISTATLKTVKVVLPKSKVIEAYTTLVQPMFFKQDLVEKENEQLTQLRDWLLPMLMNGQVTVA